MEKLEIVYNTISQKENLKNTRLSVVLSTDSLCFFIKSDLPNEGAIFYLKSSSIAEKCRIIQRISDEYQIEQFELYYDDGRYSLIPRNLFLYGYEKDYVRNVFSSSNQDVLFNDQIHHLNAVNIYAFSLLSDLEIRQQFPGVRTHHLVSNILQQYRNPSENVIFAYILQSSIYLFQFVKGELHGNVRHDYLTAEDVLFYISAIQEGNVHFNEIVLAGLITEEDEVTTVLREHNISVKLWRKNIWMNSIDIFKN